MKCLKTARCTFGGAKWYITANVYIIKKIKYITAIEEFLNNIDVLVDGKFILEEKRLNK